MKILKPASCFFLMLLLFPQVLAASSYPEGEVDQAVAEIVCKGSEKLSYRLSWSGGPKIGELHMEVTKVDGKPDHYQLHARVKDSGIFRFFYPVDDTFVTVVKGKNCLPVSYKVQQKEGRGYEALRHTEYDQQNHLVRYQKNDQEPVEYKVEGQVHNEFSSFFFTRMLQLDESKTVIVPTFADKKRNEVEVRSSKPFPVKGTLLGDVNVIAVTPIMNFKGLYNKDGDTVFWLTDDACRIPVRINSKILIGSLTAELVSYSNPICPVYPEHYEKCTDVIVEEYEFETGK